MTWDKRIDKGTQRIKGQNERTKKYEQNKTNPTGGHGCLSLVSVVCCKVFSTTG